MDKARPSLFSYRNITLLFILIWLTSVIGFHRTYTSKFPSFDGVNWIQHFHGTVLMAWYGMLIVQPLLIRYKKVDWHRKLGYLAYVLAPLVVYSIFLISRMMYQRDVVHGSEARVLGHLSIEIPTMFLFSLFFVLAMVYRKKPATHMRYMIGTSLLMIGPGLARALMFVAHVPPPIVIVLIYLLPAAIALTFLYFDYRKKRNVRPFLLISSLLVFHIVIGAGQMSQPWQTSAKWFME